MSHPVVTFIDHCTHCLQFSHFLGAYFLDNRYLLPFSLKPLHPDILYPPPLELLRIPDGLPGCSRTGLGYEQTAEGPVDHRSLCLLFFIVILYALPLLSNFYPSEAQKMTFSLASVWIITQIRMGGVWMHGFGQVYNAPNENTGRWLVVVCGLSRIPRLGRDLDQRVT